MAADDADLLDEVSMGSSDDGDDGSKTMTERFIGTFDEYFDDIVDADHIGEETNLALDAAEEFADLVVAADDEERAWNLGKSFLNQIADESQLGRKDVRGHWKEEIEVKEKEATVDDGLPHRFEDLVEETLVKAVKHTLSDAHDNETTYELGFDDGRGTTLTLSRSKLFSHSAAWKAYTSASGMYPPRKTDSDYGDDDWSNHIGELLDDIEEEEEDIGPRSAAWRSLQNRIKQAPNFEDKSDAVSRGGAAVIEESWTVETADGGSETRTVTELKVLSQDISQVTSQHDVSAKGLQHELKARGVASPRVSGISDRDTVNGSKQTLWCFDVDALDEVDDDLVDLDDVVESAEYDTDPGTTGEDEEDEDNDEDSDSGSGEDGDSPGDDGPSAGHDDGPSAGPGGSDAGPGLIGESGVAPGGDDE